MKFGVVSESTIFVLQTLQRNITHLAVITRKTNIKLGILKRGGELEKSLEPLNAFWTLWITTSREPKNQKQYGKSVYL